jgi:hypothetical protein
MSSNTTSPDMFRLADTFRAFASGQAAGNSPLYAHLAEVIAESPDLLALADAARAGQPRPNLLLGAVHYLVAQHPCFPLARFYDGTTRTGTELDAAEEFREFCARWEPHIEQVVATRSAQTNEVRRASVLLPAFAEIQRRTGATIRVIDIGSSAGLTLLWPRYRYRYGNTTVVFPTSTGLELECEPRGDLPPVDVDPNRFADPVGLEIDPVDLTDPDTCAWLDALCWPEQTERRRLLREAIAVAQDHPPRIIGGDATELLPRLIAQTPHDQVVCVVGCWSIYQIYGSPGGRQRLITQLAEASRNRTVFEVSIGHFGQSVPRMILSHHQDGTHLDHVAATCDVYGRWITWRPNENEGGHRRRRGRLEDAADDHGAGQGNAAHPGQADPRPPRHRTP